MTTTVSNKKTPHQILEELLSSEEALTPVGSASSNSSSSSMSVSQESHIKTKNSGNDDHQN